MKLTVTALSIILLLGKPASGQRSQEISFGDQSPIISGARATFSVTYNTINLNLFINCSSSDSESCEDIIHKTIESTPYVYSHAPANINWDSLYAQQPSYGGGISLKNGVYVSEGNSDSLAFSASRSIYSLPGIVSDYASSAGALRVVGEGPNLLNGEASNFISSQMVTGPDGRVFVASDSGYSLPGIVSASVPSVGISTAFGMGSNSFSGPASNFLPVQIITGSDGKVLVTSDASWPPLSGAGIVANLIYGSNAAGFTSGITFGPDGRLQFAVSEITSNGASGLLVPPRPEVDSTYTSFSSEAIGRSANAETTLLYGNTSTGQLSGAHIGVQLYPPSSSLTDSNEIRVAPTPDANSLQPEATR